MLSDSNNIAMLKNIHSARGEVYAFLCRTFGGIPTDIYHILTDISVKLEVIASNTDNEKIIKGVNGITTFHEERKGLSGKALDDFDAVVLRNYTTLFCLPKSVPTDESIYTSVEHRERLEPYMQMRALFKKYNMTKTKKISENDDFISYEFIFMSKLAYDCVNLLEADDSDTYGKYLHEQYDFHKNHLGKWLNEFCSRVINFGIKNENFYTYLSYFAEGFVAEDEKVIKELLYKE